MSLAQAVRRATSGGRKPAMEGETPDDDETVEGEQPEDGAEGKTPDDDAEGETPKDKAEDDDDEDETMAAARQAERNRIGAILGDKAAEANPPLAAHLAFNTDMAADDALAALKAGGAAKAGGGLRDRVANAPGQKPLGNGGKNGAAATTPAERRTSARSAYLAGLSNRKPKEG